MFTDPAIWRKSVEDVHRIELFGHPIAEFNYRLIKLKHIPAEELEKKAAENPLAAAYLPLTNYPEKDRPLIKAKAINGIAGLAQGPERSVLYSLIDHSLPLNSKEEKTFQSIIKENPMFREARMLQSIEEIGIEKGIERTAIKLLRSQWLNKQQISEVTGLDREKLDELENKLKSEGVSPD